MRHAERPPRLWAPVEIVPPDNGFVPNRAPALRNGPQLR
jgi:hypothetical protein